MSNSWQRPADAAFTSTRYRGQFWRQDAPEHIVKGVLRIGKHGRARIEVAADSEHASRYSSDLSGHALGELNDGRKVTLWTKPGAFHTAQFGSQMVQQWGTVILGCHLGVEDQAEFRETSISFDGIHIWTRMPTPIQWDAPRSEYPVAVLKNVYSDELPGKAPIDVSVTIENPAVVEVRPDGMPQLIRFLGEDGAISFRASRPVPLSFHRRLWFDLRSLIAFSTQRQAFLFNIRAVTSDHTTVSINEYQIGKPRRGLFGKQLLLAPGTVNPAVLFPQWWRVVDEFYPVPQVLVGDYDDRWGYLEGSAMAAFAAAEAIHAHLKLPQTRFKKDSFKRVKTAIRVCVNEIAPSDEQPDFDKYISELRNSRTFENRLLDLVDAAGIEQLKHAGIDAKAWVAAVKSARNKIAHTGSHVKARTGESRSLAVVNHATRVVLSLALRNEIATEPLAPREARDALRNPERLLLASSTSSI